MDDPKTGAWQYDFVTAVSITTSKAMASVASWAADNPDIVFVIAIVLLVCGMLMGVRYLWRRHLRSRYYWLYNRIIRNPMSWSLRPFRRLHRRWSERNMRAKMAKWKREVVADIFYDGLTKACDDQLISKHHKRRLMKELAVFFGISDLKRESKHIDAIRAKIKANETHKVGPKGVIPGGKPGENVIPIYEGLGFKFLNRKKAS